MTCHELQYNVLTSKQPCQINILADTRPLDQFRYSSQMGAIVNKTNSSNPGQCTCPGELCGQILPQLTTNAGPGFNPRGECEKNISNCLTTVGSTFHCLAAVGRTFHCLTPVGSTFHCLTAVGSTCHCLAAPAYNCRTKDVKGSMHLLFPSTRYNN